MYMGSWMCGSCAVGTITALGENKGPIDAMRAFCMSQLGVINTYTHKYSNVMCYYVFCAGPEVKKHQKGGSHHSKDHWPKYGTEFAQFIADNELGEIATLPARPNTKYHPTTTAQVWLWAPNQKALEKWWKKHQPSKAELSKQPPDPYEDEDYYEDEQDANEGY